MDFLLQISQNTYSLKNTWGMSQSYKQIVTRMTSVPFWCMETDINKDREKQRQGKNKAKQETGKQAPNKRQEEKA